MAQIMESLRADHRNMMRLLDLLEEQAQALRGDGDPEFDFLSGAVNYCLTYPDVYHHPKEDQIYRRMVELGASQAQISDLEAAHSELAGQTRLLASSLDNKPGKTRALADLVQKFVDNYRLHIEAEEKVFFPLAEQLLADSDWATLDAEMAEMPDPLFGESAGETFKRLGRRLSARSSAA